MEPKEIVKALREEMHLNRREFCDYFSIPYRTVQDWEAGKRVMPEYVLRLMEYKIRVDQMLQEKDEAESGKAQKGKKKGVIIRNMSSSDYKEVYSLWEACDGIGLNDIDDSESGIARFLLRNKETCFVAVEKNCVIGVILAGHDGRRGSIYHLAVNEEHRNQGIGTQLVEKAVAALERQGIQKATTLVFTNNAEGNMFWEKLKFTVREDLTYRNKQVK